VLSLSPGRNELITLEAGPSSEMWVNGHKVIRAWESFSGWFWFGVEKVREQLSDFGGARPVPDTIWFGLVQGFEEEWGDFSEAEIRTLGRKAWGLPTTAFAVMGRRA
jgi:hypothetical protein